MRPDNLLMVADSDHDANMLYAVGVFIPDPFIYLRINGQSKVVVSDLEIDRVRRRAPHCQVVALSQCLRRAKPRNGQATGLAEVIRGLLRTHKLRKVWVPADFPLGLANKLRDIKIKLKPRKGPFFAEREIKSADEAKKISAALIMAEVGMAEGIQALQVAKIDRRGQLSYHGAPLTSEKLRAIINVAILQVGGVASHTIVAGGKQSCDPHEQGHGPLRANQPIIIDIFPRSQKTGYFGDITRTVVKGRASEAVRKLYATVAKAQKLAFNAMNPGVKTAAVHKVAQDFFKQEGYPTRRNNGHMEGFFHGTGHGLGLEVHELPRIGPTSQGVLKAGHVVTVEPGLYYPSIGGVRLEDVAYITDTGPRNLTKFEQVLEL